MIQDSSRPYFNLDTQTKESALAYLLEALLRSREESKLTANKESAVDEDVNVYLAHLLLAFATHSYQEMVSKYLSGYDSDVRELAEEANDRHIRYFILKSNADNLLINLGVFQNLKRTIRFGGMTVSRSEKYFAENAIAYYQEAADCNQRIYRKRTAVKEVLLKLAANFEEYKELLKSTRKDYFNFLNRFQDTEFNAFLGSIAIYEKELEIKVLVNEFLDLYLKWLKEPNEVLELNIRELAQRIKRRDPQFSFELQKRAG